MKNNKIPNGQNSSIIHVQNRTNIEHKPVLLIHIYMTAHSHGTCTSN